MGGWGVNSSEDARHCSVSTLWSGHSNLGASLNKTHSIRYNEVKAWQVFLFNLIIQTHYCDLSITGMALFNQSELTAFFSPWQVNLKISHRILPNPTIPEDDLPRMAKSRKMTYRDWLKFRLTTRHLVFFLY